MELNDYEGPTPQTDFNQVYAPRPKASQQVAAQKRAKRRDTEPITPIPVASTTRQSVPFGVGAFVIILLMIGMASERPAALVGNMHIHAAQQLGELIKRISVLFNTASIHNNR